MISQKEFTKLNVKIVNVFLKYKNLEYNLIKCNCLSCNKDYSNQLDEELKKRFKSTFKFSSNDINKITLLQRKGVYLYENMDKWEQFTETKLPEKKNLIAT